MFILPKVKFSYNMFEPYFDAQTMETHYTKHHAGYVSKLNAALSAMDHAECEIEDIFENIEKYPSAVRNNAGGHFNHTLFWSLLSTNMTQVSPLLTEAIARDFGALQLFKKKFEEAALSVFGSGWAWLVKNSEGRLEILTTSGQDNPAMSDLGSYEILLGLDVWEHAYYLKYQNRRAEYIDAFWSVLDWARVSERFARSEKFTELVDKC